MNTRNVRDRRQDDSTVESQSDLYSRVISPVYLNRSFNTEHIPKYTSNDYCNSDSVAEPTNSLEKKQMFKKQLTIILSCIYAVFIVTLGLVIYISDIIIGNSALAETFSIYLLIIGFVYILYLVIDIRIYLNKQKARTVLRESKTQHQQQDEVEYGEGNLHLSIPLPSWTYMLHDTTEHYYCFRKGRHSGSFYLKVGVAGFCLGHLIHSGLLLGYQIVFLTSDGDAFYECASVATLVLDITYPVYSFLLLYFIFKYSNVIINRSLELARFALMHCMASSLCFWIWTILRETMDSLTHSSQDDEEVDSRESVYDAPVAAALTSYSKRGAKELVKFLNGSAEHRVGTVCLDDARMNIIYQNISPYLYPFTVEYSILVVGVLFIIWQNIGHCPAQNENTGTKRNCPTPGVDYENGFTSNLVINVDCHSANTGLFGGILVIVCSVVSIILFFIAISNQKYIKLGVLVNTVTEVVFVILMTISAVLAYRKITTLDVNYHQVSLLDDLLLFICIPAFFLNAIFSIVPAVQDQNGLSIANIVLQVIQIIIQTPLIIDGLRRCSNSRELRQTKPGRGLITFLVVCNVAMWITETFQIKSHELLDVRYVFYGKQWWTIIGHMTVPLTMFYRFHSSVCLVDIWKSAYEPAENH
ncbi:Otopetrin-like c [Carabus blaptoides fortunei]